METSLRIVRVQDIILDEEHLEWERCGQHDSIGTILYTEVDSPTPLNEDYSELPFARPIFSSVTAYPIKNEIVYLTLGPDYNFNEEGASRDYYLPPLGLQNHPTHNALPTQLSNDVPTLTNEEIESGATVGEDEKFVKLGRYFKELENIRPLRPYEGDTIVEGRYGNSIRLGATTFNQLLHSNRWSNEGEIGNPITIIRNGQIGDEQKSSFEHIIEDIDGDDSSIYLTSKQQLTGFTPASIYNLSFGANLELNEQTVEPEPVDEPMSEDVEEEVTPTPPPPPPPPPIEEEEEPVEEIVEYDDAPAENQAIFPTDAIGDLPYENPESIDLDMVLGTYDPPPIHGNAEDTINVTQQHQLQSSGAVKTENNPYGFYYTKQGPRGKITVKDKNLETVYEGNISSGTISELINEAKAGLSIY